MFLEQLQVYSYIFKKKRSIDLAWLTCPARGSCQTQTRVYHGCQTQARGWHCCQTQTLGSDKVFVAFLLNNTLEVHKELLV